MSETSGTSQTLTSEDFKITPDFSPEEYEKNWSDRLCDIDERNDYEEREKVFHKFYKHIWNLLFGPGATEETRIKAVKFLIVNRCDASYFEPYIYNDWIRSVKDETIRNELFDLWKNEFVKNDLGLFWSKNCDYFDVGEVLDAEEFYKL